MSLLAPLYALGALAIALPVIFHLIRRHVRQRTPISSTLFLPVTQPRVRNRSRVENLPLLLLRVLAVLLLALAFSRPFLRSTSTQGSAGMSRRFLVLVDTSASMRRGDLWQQALGELSQVTQALNPGDDLAIMAFDSKPTVRIDFDTARGLPLETLRALGSSLFADQSPSWNETDLGAALRAAADRVLTEQSASAEGSSGPDLGSQPRTQIVLISDLQSGARSEALQGATWPADLPVEIRRVTLNARTNAWVSLPRDSAAIAGSPYAAETTSTQSAPEVAGDQEASEAEATFRIRVANSRDSDRAQFRLAWLKADGRPADVPPRSVQVPPGQSLSVRLPFPPGEAVAIELSGDDHDFDNLRYFANRPPRPQTVWFLGPDATEPRDSLVHYLRQLSLDTPARTIAFAHHAPAAGPAAGPGGPLVAADPRSIPLIFATGTIDQSTTEALLAYVRDGGRLAYVLPPASEPSGVQPALRAWLDSDSVTVTESQVSDYAMWARIEFSHPLFAPLAGPEFNDFSRIRFWAHRDLSNLPEDCKTLVTYDDGSPALVERLVGQGRIWLFASGWQPQESQLALSTKFIPLMFGLVDADRPDSGSKGQVVVGDPFPLTMAADASAVEIERITEPAASLGQLSAGELAVNPGIYRLRSGGDEERVAVNLSESESRIEPMATDELERLGVVLGTLEADQSIEQRERQLRDVELESKQTLWRWLLIGVLALLGLETFISGWAARRGLAAATG